jgi:hypothetical protein
MTSFGATTRLPERQLLGDRGRAAFPRGTPWFAVELTDWLASAATPRRVVAVCRPRDENRWRTRIEIGGDSKMIVIELFLSFLDALAGAPSPGEPRFDRSQIWRWLGWAAVVLATTLTSWWLWFRT